MYFECLEFIIGNNYIVLLGMCNADIQWHHNLNILTESAKALPPQIQHPKQNIIFCKNVLLFSSQILTSLTFICT